MVRGKTQQQSTPKVQSGVRKTTASKKAGTSKHSDCKSSAGSKAASTPTCNGCGTPITENVKALQCDKCQSNLSWKCIECANVKETTYDEILQDGDCELKWICAGCEKGFDSSDKMDSLLVLIEKIVDRNVYLESKLDRIAEEASVAMVASTLNEQQQQIDKQFKDLETKVNKKIDELSIRICHHIDSLEKGRKEDEVKAKVGSSVVTVEEKVDKIIAAVENKNTNSRGNKEEKLLHVEEAISNRFDEDKDIEARKSNIIIYRVPEDRKATPEERKKTDNGFLLEMCEEVFGVPLQSEDISKQFRLGSLSEDNKVRPLLVSFKDVNKKEMILSNIRNLKMCGGKFKSVSIAHDLTPKQRRTVQELLEAARKDNRTVEMRTRKTSSS